jgi:serine/threonine protein kinase
MSLTIGTHLGSHEITALLGKGGMGEVYLARDLKLKREVAIKILPEEFSRDADRASRFQYEAEALASLNHPNIAAIYDLEETDGIRFLVLEFVEGATLADLLNKRGKLPVDEALAIARQICEAVAAAHQKSIVHRDLKPANIKVMANGKVKVLDFGLAKVLEERHADVSISSAATINDMATNAGAILGTPAYMSPEQAKGRALDPRTDVFAFGCVLYEMLSGQPAFPGDSAAEIIAAVLSRDPDWSRLPAGTPPGVRRMLRRTLKKDVEQRLSDIRDARIEIEDAGIETGDSSVAVTAVKSRPALTSIIFPAIALSLIAALAIPAWRHMREQIPSEMRLQIVTPSTSATLDFALSPDGRSIAFVASGEGAQRLWLRPLEKTEAQVFAGTEGASYPFWSPDSRSIAFFAAGKLQRVDVAGGPPQTIANAAVGRGGAWNTQGTIVFAATPFTPLLRVSAAGGEPTPVTAIDPPRQTGHHFPQFLPDGRHFFYYVQGDSDTAGIYLTSLDGGPPKFLTKGESARFVAPDLVYFQRESVLFAQRVDVKQWELLGEPARVADPVGSDGAASGHGGFSASADGRIAYRGVNAALRQLAWFDRSGKPMGTAGEAKPNLASPELSRDGRRLAIQFGPGILLPNIWLMDLPNGSLTRFTFGQGIDNAPLWSPDGTQIVYSSSQKGQSDLYLKSSSQTGTEQALLETKTAKFARDWSADGRFLLYSSDEPKSGRDLMALDLSGNDRKSIAVANTPFNENNGQFSPNAGFVVYDTNESGRSEIVVQPFPQATRKWQISTNGGIQPRWSRDGKEIYFIAPDAKLMAVPVSASSANFTAGPPAPLFQTHVAASAASNKQQYTVSRDGLFLINQAVETGASSPITLVLNWHRAIP